MKKNQWILFTLSALILITLAVIFILKPEQNQTREASQVESQPVPTATPTAAPTVSPEEVKKLILKGVAVYKNKNLASNQRTEQAIQYFSAALKLDPENAEALHYRARMYQDYTTHDDRAIAREKIQQAIADFSESIRIFPDDAANYAYRADAYKGLMMYSESPSEIDELTEKYNADWNKTCSLGGECTNSSDELTNESRNNFPKGCIPHYTLLNKYAFCHADE